MFFTLSATVVNLMLFTKLSYKTKQGYNSFLTAPDKEMLKKPQKHTSLFY